MNQKYFHVVDMLALYTEVCFFDVPNLVSPDGQARADYSAAPMEGAIALIEQIVGSKFPRYATPIAGFEAWSFSDYEAVFDPAKQALIRQHPWLANCNYEGEVFAILSKTTDDQDQASYDYQQSLIRKAIEVSGKDWHLISADPSITPPWLGGADVSQNTPKIQ